MCKGQGVSAEVKEKVGQSSAENISVVGEFSLIPWPFCASLCVVVAASLEAACQDHKPPCAIARSSWF